MTPHAYLRLSFLVTASSCFTLLPAGRSHADDAHSQPNQQPIAAWQIQSSHEPVVRYVSGRISHRAKHYGQRYGRTVHHYYSSPFYRYYAGRISHRRVHHGQRYGRTVHHFYTTSPNYRRYSCDRRPSYRPSPAMSDQQPIPKKFDRAERTTDSGQ